MNDITAILAKIGADAKAQEENTIAAAQLAAQATQESYRQRGHQEVDATVEEAKRQAEAIHQRAISQSGIEGRNRRLLARRQAIELAFERAMDLLCDMDKHKRAEFYMGLAIQYMMDDAELILTPKDREEIGQEVAEGINAQCKAQGKGCKATLSPKTGAFRGGFVLSQGSVESNCTFEVLSKGLREDLEAEVAAVLFG